MPTANEKLADSLEQLKALQDSGQRVIRSGVLTRVHRERLAGAGYLEEVVKGWYLPVRPDVATAGQTGSTAAWFAGIRDFIAGYCDARFGEDWHLAPEQSLLLLSGDRNLPKQLQVWSPAASNQALELPHGCSMFMYRAAKSLPSSSSADNNGIRLANLHGALIAVSSGFFVQHKMAATICLGLLDDTAPLLEKLLDGSHSVIAGRLAGAYRALERPDFADAITLTMRSADYVVKEESPFDLPPDPLPGGRPESPYVQRLRRTWADMRAPVVDAFPASPSREHDSEWVLRDVEDRYVADAYHSLSIEGYRVTPEMIEKVRNGTWDPDGADKDHRNAMAAKGYLETHNEVKAFIKASIDSQRGADGVRPQRIRDALSSWYRALFSPSVQTGLLRPADLAGWRNDQVFIRGAMHVPLSKEAVRDCMPVLFEMIDSEPNPAVGAVLGHFFFVYIHPYMDGNGRLGRFLLNAMLVSGGYVWTIVPVEQRKPYMHALERASSFGDIKPFAEFLAVLTQAQTDKPLPRPAE